MGYYDKPQTPGGGIPTNPFGAALYALGQLGNMFRPSSPIDVKGQDGATTKVNPFKEFFGGFNLGGKNVSIVPPGQEDSYDAISKVLAGNRIEQMLGGNDYDTYIKQLQIKKYLLDINKKERDLGKSGKGGEGDVDGKKHKIWEVIS